jgi:hypothetical protein
MREIKFRAQYIGRNTMIYFTIAQCNVDISIDRNTIQQSTNLHDKQGKEVYEGDILEFNDPDDYERGKVVFQSGAFQYLCEDGSRDLLSDCCLMEMSIIGNIIENPELLG